MTYADSEVTDYDPHELARAARGESDFMRQQDAAYLLARVPVPIEERIIYWHAWAVIATMCALASGGIVLVILSRPKLRRQAYNHFVIGLAVPDMIFSGLCAMTCALNASHGDYFDGGVGSGQWMCNFQGAYMVFGAAGSIWVNVLVVIALDELMHAMHRREAVTLTVKKAWKQIIVVYLFCIAFTFVVTHAVLFNDKVPSVVHTVRGLACLPIGYDDESQTFLLTFTMSLLVYVPAAIMLCFGVRIALVQAARAQSHTSAGLSLTAQPAHGDAEAADAEAHSSMAEGAEALRITEEANRALVRFFSKLLILMVIMWLPFFFIFWVTQPPYYTHVGVATFTGGSWGHIQGLISAYVYSQKGDIRRELGIIANECLSSGGPAAVDPEARAEGAIENLHIAGAATLVEDHTIATYGVDDHGKGQDMPSTGRSRIGRSTQESLGGVGDHSSLSLAMAELAEETKAHILASETYPMRVVELDTFKRHGCIPASSAGVTRPYAEGDVVIFISHRWWSAEFMHPDDDRNTKHALICRGIAEIVARHGIHAAKVVVWIDYACIDQEDESEQRKGIASLFAYASKASFVLIPVEPKVEAFLSLGSSTHPMDLIDYGERAWCRCEIYVFACIAEMTGQPALVYAYGSMDVDKWLLREDEASATVRRSTAARTSAADGTPRRKSVMPRIVWKPSPVDAAAGCISASGRISASDPSPRSRVSEGASFVAWRAQHVARRIWLRCRRAMSRSRDKTGTGESHLRPLLSTLQGSQGARFRYNELPSSGELTVESDRAVIASIEEAVRDRYVQYALLAAGVRYAESAPKARDKDRVFSLDSKQMQCKHARALAAYIESDSRLADMTRLTLCDNLLADRGVRDIAMFVVAAPHTRNLRTVVLDGNARIGVDGIEALSDCLAAPTCALTVLSLRRCELGDARGEALHRGIAESRSLEKLDVSDNLFGDRGAFGILDAAARGRAVVGTNVEIILDNNPVSTRVLQLASASHLSAAAGIGVVSGPTGRGTPQPPKRAGCRGSPGTSASAAASPQAACRSPARPKSPLRGGMRTAPVPRRSMPRQGSPGGAVRAPLACTRESGEADGAAPLVRARAASQGDYTSTSACARSPLRPAATGPQARPAKSMPSSPSVAEEPAAVDSSAGAPESVGGSAEGGPDDEGVPSGARTLWLSSFEG